MQFRIKLKERAFMESIKIIKILPVPRPVFPRMVWKVAGLGRGYCRQRFVNLRLDFFLLFLDFCPR